MGPRYNECPFSSDTQLTPTYLAAIRQDIVVLYSNESEAVDGGGGDGGDGGWARAVAEGMLGRGRDAGWTGQLWVLETFLTVRPAVHVFTRPHQDSRGSYCVAFVILAPLDRVARALTPIQRGVWFVGSNKYLLVYPGSNILVTSASLSSHPLLGEDCGLYFGFLQILSVFS
ncbi:hypothetical protein Pcinc_038899 [Petrolisthes cinctipes]|uniref:Uncharacterized protein n=1 Tax=Petrolisthes cinctipes TaxID=88211 RepID=A0AAE1BTF8_PETCI|nr:hypothetical protein Pcinc_038899 [Petrolisthes cinctipes]